MTSVLPLLRRHFDGLQDRFTSFARHGVQTQAWFKGELLTLLDRWQAAGDIVAFDREVALPSGKRVDLAIDLGGARHWVELKHWLIGRQKKSTYNCRFYFGDGSSVGVLPDVQKLRSLGSEVPRLLLILMTCHPGTDDWNAGVELFNDKFTPARVRDVAGLDGFPPAYALGLLRVE